MARTNNKPGPKPGTTKKYGKRRDYHFRLLEETKEGKAKSLADAFDAVSARHGGDNAFIVQLLESHPEIIQEMERIEDNA